MVSLIEVIDCYDIESKITAFNNYLDDSPLGEICPLERAYFKVLYDLNFRPASHDLNEKEFGMTKIDKVCIDFDDNTYDKYFTVYFRCGKTLEITKSMFDHYN